MKIFLHFLKSIKKVGYNYNYRATFLPFSQPHFFQNLRPLQTADYTHKTQPHNQPNQTNLNTSIQPQINP